MILIELKILEKHEPYERALDIAKLLLLNFRPDLKAGKQKHDRIDVRYEYALGRICL